MVAENSPATNIALQRLYFSKDRSVQQYRIAAKTLIHRKNDLRLTVLMTFN